jgi:hypothetical protein
MNIMSTRDGWERLPNGFDVEFRHSIPVRISDNGHGLDVPEDVLREEVTALGKLHICLGDWHSGETSGEREACLYGSDREFKEVLRRLAVSSAALFIDRFRKPIEDNDVDWDRLEFLKDFSVALDYCRLSMDDVDTQSCFEDYIEAMHHEALRLAQTGDLPLVAPE